MSEGGVSLSASVRANLQILSTTDKLVGRAEGRLSTGLKVNSALDGPSVYFSAKSLNNRASDLTALKDAMGQAISTLNAANTGIDHVNDLVEQAKGLTAAAFGSLGSDEGSVMIRANLAKQYDELLKQIDAIAGDSGYHGKNLIIGDGTKYGATVESKAKVADIPGVSGVQATDVTKPDKYQVTVTGDGTISADGSEAAEASDTCALSNLKIYGFNNKDKSNFDNITVKLSGKENADRTIRVSDGSEAHDITVTQDQIKAARQNGTKISFDNIYESGLHVKFDVDLDTITKVEPASASIKKYVDLSVNVTDQQGNVQTHTLNDNQDLPTIKDGENDFSFDNGTVRLNVDLKDLQKASTWEQKVVGPTGGLANSIVGITANNNLDKDVTFIVDASRMANALYYSVRDFNETSVDYGVLCVDNDPIQTTNLTARLYNWQVIGQIQIDPTKTTDSNGISVNYRDASGSVGEGIIISQPWGTAGDMLADNGWSGFNQTCELTVGYGDPDSAGTGQKTLNINDGLGGTWSGTIGNETDVTNFVDRYQKYTLSGGPNDGAKIVLNGTMNNYACTYKWIVSVGANPGIMSHTNYNSFDLNDVKASYGWKKSGEVDFNIGGADSAGVGYRTVTMADAFGGTSTATITNAPQNDVAFKVNGGINNGANIQIDFLNSGAGLDQYYITSNYEAVGDAEFTIRAGNKGKSAELITTMTSSGNSDNDLSVQFDEKNLNTLQINAVDVTTSGTGLSLDQSINNWASREDVEKANSELVLATSRIRDAAQQLSTNTNIVTTRSDFTKEFSDILTEGANKLTEADQNEEGCSLLMLQTRQQLATTSLGLGVKSQQNILKLF